MWFAQQRRRSTGSRRKIACPCQASTATRHRERPAQQPVAAVASMGGQAGLGGDALLGVTPTLVIVAALKISSLRSSAEAMVQIAPGTAGRLAKASWRGSRKQRAPIDGSRVDPSRANPFDARVLDWAYQLQEDVGPTAAQGERGQASCTANKRAGRQEGCQGWIGMQPLRNCVAS